MDLKDQKQILRLIRIAAVGAAAALLYALTEKKLKDWIGA